MADDGNGAAYSLWWISGRTSAGSPAKPNSAYIKTDGKKAYIFDDTGAGNDTNPGNQRATVMLQFGEAANSTDKSDKSDVDITDITDEVIQQVKDCYDLAPLHNPANITGIEAITALLPDVPQVGVFDTAFHQTMPARSFMYAIPYEYYKNDGVRRYGFHGTSHRYVSQRVAEILGEPIEKLKMVTCHIGNGGSITAVDGGKSIDTSMGLTPTEGLMMGTRTGDIDPGAITYLMTKHGMSAADVQTLINKKSGVAGISGISNDMREIEAAVNAGDPRAKLALDMYELRILKYVGAYAAEMGGLDVIVFTGGVGENQTGVRENVCEPLKFMGVEIDKELNAVTRGTETIISTPSSRVKVLIVPTDEELTIARDTQDIVSKLKK